MKHVIAMAAMLAFAWCASAQTGAATSSAWRNDVRSVMLYPSSAGYNPVSSTPVPVIAMDGSERLVLEFDVLSAEAAELRWSIVHCNRHWEPDELAPQEFISGFEEGSVGEFEYSFTTTTDFVHYRCILPERFATFTHSGNYLLTVSDVGGGQVLLTRRFCVSEQAEPLQASVGRPYDGIGVAARQEVDVVLTASSQDMPYTHVAVQQNGRVDNMRWLEFSGYDGGRLTYRHRQCNIFDGGNTFRFFDCSNMRSPMYNVVQIATYGGELMAMLKPEEDRSAKHYLAESTLGGGLKINIQDRDNPRLEADYVWVNFSLPMAQPMLDGNVYVVGGLTDWQLDSTSLMEYNPKIRAYTKRLLLKQGYYAYQLLVRPSGQTGSGNTARLEGDHFESPNRYTVYAYRHAPSDRADRLVAVATTVR